jgi:carbon monoxide dehydrogenase subunit G
LVTGFVTECTLQGNVRLVKFANGLEAREVIVDVDDQERRVVWSAVGGKLTHHNASAQVFPTADASCEVVWVADLLPNELAPAIAQMIEQGLAAMKRTLEGRMPPDRFARAM